MLSAFASAGIKSYQGILAVSALAAYLLVCFALAGIDLVRPPGSSIYLLLGVWLGGAIALLAVGNRPLWANPGSVTLGKALWVNLGLVCVSVLLPMPVRVLLLFVPLFGILYTALYLSRAHVLLVALLTWLSNVAAVAVLFAYTAADLAFEALLLGGFTLLLVAMVYLAGEVTAQRSAFARRRERLTDALSQLSDLAMRDDLTGLFNRRYIMEVLRQQKALADRGHVGFTVCYCDLDHFKSINDRFGHAQGDRVLAQFAEIAGGVVRSMDYAARIGGEEFMLVLVGADQAEALHVAQRLAERTRALTVEDGEVGLSVSTGIATYGVDEPLEDVIQRADLALYRAKSGGRDRIIVGE